MRTMTTMSNLAEYVDRIAVSFYRCPPSPSIPRLLSHP